MFSILVRSPGKQPTANALSPILRNAQLNEEANFLKTTIRTLLFLTAVAAGLAALFVTLLEESKRSRSRPDWLISQSCCESLHRIAKTRGYTVAELKRALNGRADAELKTAGIDFWGNQLQVATVDGDIGIYSLGRDGISVSNGNDPDDISTWNGAGRAYQTDGVLNDP